MVLITEANFSFFPQHPDCDLGGHHTMRVQARISGHIVTRNNVLFANSVRYIVMVCNLPCGGA